MGKHWSSIWRSGSKDILHKESDFADILLGSYTLIYFLLYILILYIKYTDGMIGANDDTCTGTLAGQPVSFFFLKKTKNKTRKASIIMTLFVIFFNSSLDSLLSSLKTTQLQVVKIFLDHSLLVENSMSNLIQSMLTMVSVPAKILKIVLVHMD